jgi:hypothetical protein
MVARCPSEGATSVRATPQAIQPRYLQPQFAAPKTRPRASDLRTCYHEHNAPSTSTPIGGTRAVPKILSDRARRRAALFLQLSGGALQPSAGAGACLLRRSQPPVKVLQAFKISLTHGPLLFVCTNGGIASSCAGDTVQQLFFRWGIQERAHGSFRCEGKRGLEKPRNPEGTSDAVAAAGLRVPAA